VELNFVAGVHCDLKWNFRSAIIGARQRSETAAQQQSQRADDDSFLVSFFIHHETFLTLFVFTHLTGAKAVTAGAFADIQRFGDLAAPNKSDSINATNGQRRSSRPSWKR